MESQNNKRGREQEEDEICGAYQLKVNVVKNAPIPSFCLMMPRRCNVCREAPDETFSYAIGLMHYDFCADCIKKQIADGLLIKENQ